MAHVIKDWNKFQHFKDRRPPWIKLYRDILDDPEWFELDAEASKALVMLWLIASETDGYLPDIKKISFRLRISEAKAKSLIDKLSHWLVQDDITAISDRYQDDAPETETETETEKRTAKVYDARSHLVSLGVDKLIADDWLKTRKLKKLASTETAINAVVNEANKSGKSLADIIRICCEQGWGGFKASWELPASPSAAGQSLREMCV